jgi:hypothetical protein
MARARHASLVRWAWVCAPIALLLVMLAYLTVAVRFQGGIW